MAEENSGLSPEDEELFEAYESGNIDNVELAWTKRGWNVNGIYFGMTPLTLASFKGHLAQVKILLGIGADANEVDEYGSTPLSASCFLGHSDVAFELIKRGADVNKADNNGLTLLMIASKFNHSNTINILIENGADVNAKGKQGWTALHIAAVRNHKDPIITLLQNGADPNTTNEDGKTAVDLAEDQEIKDILTRAKENRLTREEFDVGKSENYSRFAEYLAKDRERCDDEIERLREEKEKLLRGQRRVEESILSRLDELAQSVKDIPPRLTRNEFDYSTNIKTENNNYGEKAGYQFFNFGQSKLAGELSSEVGEGVVHLTIRIALLEFEMRVIDREIEKLKNSKKDAGTSEIEDESSSAGLTEETPDKLKKRIDQLTAENGRLEAEKAAQSVELRRTKELLEKTMATLEETKAGEAADFRRTDEDKQQDGLKKTVETLVAEKEALMVELRELREGDSRSKAMNVQQRITILEMETRLKELKVSMEWNPETEKDELQ